MNIIKTAKQNYERARAEWEAAGRKLSRETAEEGFGMETYSVNRLYLLTTCAAKDRAWDLLNQAYLLVDAPIVEQDDSPIDVTPMGGW